MYYEIAKSNDACKALNIPQKARLWRKSWSRSGDYADRSYELEQQWLSTSYLRPGQQICATCYPKYMRSELGNRCPGTGYPGQTSRWRALNTFDCQGTFRMISVPQRACACRRQPTSFILTWHFANCFFWRSRSLSWHWQPHSFIQLVYCLFYFFFSHSSHPPLPLLQFVGRRNRIMVCVLFYVRVCMNRHISILFAYPSILTFILSQRMFALFFYALPPRKQKKPRSFSSCVQIHTQNCI